MPDENCCAESWSRQLILRGGDGKKYNRFPTQGEKPVSGNRGERERAMGNVLKVGRGERDRARELSPLPRCTAH